jgi:hypothetical protein
MRDIIPGFIWLQGRSEKWFLMAIDDIRTIWGGNTDGTSEIYYRSSGEDHWSVVLHTVEEIGDLIRRSRCWEIRMREQVRDEFRRLP